MSDIDETYVIEILQDILHFCEQHKDSNEYDYVVCYEPDDIQFITNRVYLKDYINEKITKLGERRDDEKKFKV